MVNFKQIITYAVIAIIAWYVYSTYIRDNTLSVAEVDVISEKVNQAAADAGINLEKGDTVVDEDSDESFTVIQGGGYPAGGLGGIYRTEGFRPRALGNLGMEHSVRSAMESFENVIPRALGNLGEQRTTQIAMNDVM